MTHYHVLNVCGVPEYISVHHLCARALRGHERCHILRVSRVGYTTWCWGANPGPLQEQSVLLTGEPTLQHYKRDTVQPLPLEFLLDHHLEDCFGFIQPKHCKMKNANSRNLEMAQQLKTCCFSRGAKLSSQHPHCAHAPAPGNPTPTYGFHRFVHTSGTQMYNKCIYTHK